MNEIQRIPRGLQSREVLTTISDISRYESDRVRSTEAEW